MLFRFPAYSRENNRMEKAAAFVSALFLSIVLVTSADTDALVCGSPPDIEGAITPGLKDTVGIYPVGTAVVYNCPYGYFSLNSINHVSVCNVNPRTGRPEWKTPEITCIQREEIRIIPPNVELQISHGGNPPGTNLESSNPQPIDATRNPECFCTYAYNDSSVKVQTTDRILAEKDAVKLGETVSFECQSSSHSLKWENDLVFYEKAYMTCRICKEWQRNDLPICTRALRSCKIPLIENGEMNKIRYSRDGSYTLFTKIRAGENVESQQTLILRCKDGHFAIQNSTLTPNNTVEVICSDGAWSKDLLCKERSCEIPKIAGGSLKEEQLGDWTWKRTWNGLEWYRVKHYVVMQTGNTVSSGSVLWFYCDEPYSVHGDGKQSVQTRCVRGRWTTELQCLLDGEILVPSTATSILNRWTSVPELARNSFATSHEYVPPPTTPNTEELAPSTKVDEIKPEEIVTPQTSLEPPEKECFCEYSIEENNIVAHADGRRLIYGDRVRKGSTVLFHCLHVGYHRFRGHREITCNGCQSWDVRNFPFCVPPIIGDTAIFFSRDINVLPDGSIEINKGQNVNFTCVTKEIAQFPDWRAPESPGITLIRERRERKEYGDVVYLTHLQIQNADYEKEGTYECYTDDSHKTMLQVVVTDPNLRCPELPEDGRTIIRYNMERRENSKVSFSCPKKGQELIGKPVLTCLRSGEWSDSPPYCSGVRCKELTSNDLLQIDYSKEREIGSHAAFHCPFPGKRSGVSLTVCLEDGTWEHPTPTCKFPNCMIKDLLSSVPHNAVPVVDSMKTSFLPYNSTVKLACTDGMVAVGNPKAKCDKDAKWKIYPFQCSYGCQAPIKSPSSELLLNPVADIYRIGEKLTLSCPPGMILDKESEVIMCISSGWSDPVLPDCKDLISGDERRT